MQKPQLNWLVIGIGDITTKRIIPAILREERSRLHSILTRHPEKARPYEAQVYTDLQSALADSRLDAVYVASPVFLHAPQTIASLQSGRHVLCEKPMAMNHAEAQSMAAAARSAAKTLGIAYYRRTYPKVARAMRLIEEGVVGRPVMAYATSHDWFNAEDGRRAWLLDPAMSGGGPLFDIASHRIDLLNFFFGQPGSVRAEMSNAVHRGRVEDNATVVIEYRSKVRGIVDVRWHSRVPRDEFRIIGTDGELDLTPLNGPHLVSPRGREEIPPDSNIHFPCVRNFVDSVLDGATLLSGGETALWTDWVTQKAIESALGAD